MSLRLISLSLSNIRGFTNATLDMTRNPLLLVGENNSGKSAALVILDWVFNKLSPSELEDNVEAREGDWDILQPARDTGKRARRILLHIQFSDGRTARSFRSDASNTAILRLDLRQSPTKKIIARIGSPSKDEKIVSDPKGIQLLKKLKSVYDYEYIPAFRDAASTRFTDGLIKIFEETLSEGATHNVQAGAPAGYRKIKKARETIKKVTDDLLQPVLNEIVGAIPAGLVSSASPSIEIDNDEIVRWMAQNIKLKLSTGEHDKNSVYATNVGSGLQSLLALALNKTTTSKKTRKILALDEPEAFLHPSAQRTMARLLISQAKSTNQLIITTHSPIIVEEAKYQDIIVTSEHTFYSPKKEDTIRNEINTSFLCGYGAEMMFATSILFVEGEGDRLFFENLRRRLAYDDVTGKLDKLYVVVVGGNNRFAPWIKLIDSYRSGMSQRRFKYTCVVDSDSANQVLTAIKDADISIDERLKQRLNEVQSSFSSLDIPKWRIDTLECNKSLATESHNPFLFLECDLEFSMLKDASPSTIVKIAKVAKYSRGGKDEFIKWLGSKGIDGHVVNDPQKAPWIRAKIGELLPFQELSVSVKSILDVWISGALPEKEKKLLYDKVSL